MNQKLVFIDIDGTLFDNEHDMIHPSTIEAIRDLKKNGNLVCIASGRSKVLGDEVFSRYNLEFDGYVLINGQYVLVNDEVIYKKCLNKNFIKEFVSDCQSKHLDYGFMTGDETFVSSHSDRVVTAFTNFKMKIPRTMNPDDLAKDLFQGLIFNQDATSYFSQKYAQYVRILPWIHDGADIIPLDSSKAIGMAKICEKLHIKRENVIAIGDSLNDIEMLQYAHIGIAMGNAKQAVKEIADFVTDDIDKDGLARALKKLNLI